MLVVLICGTQWGCSNAYRNYSSKTSKPYLIEKARALIDAYEFTQAINILRPLSDADPGSEELSYLTATAYAGRAGLRVLDLFQSLADDISSRTLLQIFARHIPGSTVPTYNDIETAIKVIEAYGSRATNRSQDMNFLALFVFYARIGTLLNLTAYNTDNTLRSNFKACHRLNAFSAASTGLTNDQVDIIMVTIPRIIETVSTISGTGAAFDAIQSISNLQALGIASFDAIPCSANSENPKCLAVRSLVNLGTTDGGIGLGTGEGTCSATTP
jgi:hypothetical protein